jgi:hypothetical protein
MVSGMANDPMAGPRALQELRAAQTPSLQDELNRYRLRQMQRDEAQAEQEEAKRQRLAAAASDPRIFTEVYRQEYPEEAARASFAQSLKPPSAQSLKVIDTPEGPKYVTAQEAEGQKPYYRPPASALQITGYDEQGRPLLQVGGQPITNATRSKVEGKELDAQDTLARLEQIRSSFRPEFQQWGTKMGQRWSQMKESAGVGLSDAESKQLSELAQFQASAYENMSLILNQLSGAAISPAEFERLSRFLPNVGSGVFDGDSPTQFKAKLENFDRSVKAAISRYQETRARGSGGPSFDTPLPEFGVPGQGAAAEGVPEGATPHPSIPGLFVMPDGSGWVR